MQHSAHYQMTEYLLREGAQPITDIQSLYMKCDMLMMGMSELEIISLLPENPEQPRILTFPIPPLGHDKGCNNTLIIDNNRIPRVTVRYLGIDYGDRKGSELGEEGSSIIILGPNQLEAGLVYDITPGTTLARKLGWGQ